MELILFVVAGTISGLILEWRRRSRWERDDAMASALRHLPMPGAPTLDLRTTPQPPQPAGLHVAYYATAVLVTFNVPDHEPISAVVPRDQWERMIVEGMLGDS